MPHDTSGRLSHRGGFVNRWGFASTPKLCPSEKIETSALDTDGSYQARVLLFMLMHIPLAVAFRWNSLLPSAHALFVLVIGMLFAFKDRKPHRLIYIIAYITGAELLWRGTEASVFWEYGKYATTFLLMLAMVTRGGLAQADKRPMIYFFLLLPSILVLPVFDREGIAFNLSGPLSLAVATMFFSSVEVTSTQLKRIFIAVLGPTIGVGFLATYLTITAESIVFTGSSIRETSAGMGPNQVSSILGLGALVAFLYLFIDRKNKSLRGFMIGATIWLLAQAALTFSRGGVWAALGAIGVAVFYLLRNRRARTIFVSAGTVIFIVGYFLVFPALEDFTESTLGLRFKSFEVTGREKIIQGDLQAFREHPWLGVGPDQSKSYHSLYFRFSSAHTEYTRMLAEHGTLGVLALLILVWMGLKRFSRRSDPASRAYSVSFSVWALLFMLHAAMRLVAPSFMFGLASSVFTLESETTR